MPIYVPVCLCESATSQRKKKKIGKREVERAREKKKWKKSNQFHSYTLTLFMNAILFSRSICCFLYVCVCVCLRVSPTLCIFFYPFRMQCVCILFFIYLFFVFISLNIIFEPKKKVHRRKRCWRDFFSSRYICYCLRLFLSLGVGVVAVLQLSWMYFLKKEVIEFIEM